MKGVLKFVRISHRLFCYRALLAGLLILPAQFLVKAETLNLTVIAKVEESSCSVVIDDLEQSIDMGELDVRKLESSGKSDITFFTIRLEKCTTTSAKISFNSPFADNEGLFYPAGGQTWGYLLGFTSQDGIPLPLGKEHNLLLNGSSLLKFGVVARKSGELRMGDFNSFATATISYL